MSDISNLPPINNDMARPVNKSKMLLHVVVTSLVWGAITLPIIFSLFAKAYITPYNVLLHESGLTKEEVHSYLERNGIDLDEKGENIVRLIQAYSINALDAEAVKEGIYHGIAYGLNDIYSGYINEEDYAKMLENNAGELVGVGVTVEQSYYDGVIKIIHVVSDGPAAKAGVRPGDLLSEVNDEMIAGKTLDEITKIISGKAGTNVSLTVFREKDRLRFEMARAHVVPDQLYYRILDNNIGYIRLDQFDGKAAEQFRGALDEFDNNNIDKFILDLRDNGGGSVDVAEEIGSMLLPEGTFAKIVGRDNLTSFEVVSSGREKQYAIVCLVNRNTASASELLAGALNQLNDSVLIGEKTFGKGVAQTIIDLEDGTALRLTTSKYYLPDGTCIHEVGIEPDIEMEDYSLNTLYNESYSDEELLEKDKNIAKAVEIFENGKTSAREYKIFNERSK